MKAGRRRAFINIGFGNFIYSCLETLAFGLVCLT